ncbi:hypothetical protein Zmor_002520 [Zophobas morio]|uniref:Uncharacterized protein n=1 Tax=Zophobas morio TaxID=2755281 RepID=A0AA38J6J7_9CUCU|nr:hypothetical protein Zmor_002520 [Zophobas morio]
MLSHSARWSRRSRHGMQGTHRRDVVDYRTGYIRSHLRSPSGRLRKLQELATRVEETVASSSLRLIVVKQRLPPFLLTTKPTKLNLAYSPRGFTDDKQTKCDATEQNESSSKLANFYQPSH